MPLSTIGSNQITDGAIAVADVADGSITTAKLADNAVTTAKITDGNITTAKVADDAVGNTKLDLSANYDFTGTITGAGGITSAQTFRLSQDVNGTANLQMFTPFEETDTDYTRVGSSNWSVSSGAFSVATTGTYLCLYHASITGQGGGGDEFDLNIEISTNSGASYTTRARTFAFASGAQKTSASNFFIFTVSATSGFRLRMTAGNVNSIATNSTIEGSSDKTMTGITFIKIGA